MITLQTNKTNNTTTASPDALLNLVKALLEEESERTSQQKDTDDLGSR